VCLVRVVDDEPETRDVSVNPRRGDISTKSKSIRRQGQERTHQAI
jgi:hypothetical protein